PALGPRDALWIQVEDRAQATPDQPAAPASGEQVEVARPGHDDCDDGQPGGDQARPPRRRLTEIDDIDVARHRQWDSGLLDVEEEEAGAHTEPPQQPVHQRGQVAELLWQVALQESRRQQNYSDRKY